MLPPISLNGEVRRSAAHRRFYLPLLPSGPDGVHKFLSHRARPPHLKTSINLSPIRKRISGQRTRSVAFSTRCHFLLTTLTYKTKSHFAITERGGFEPPKQLMAVYTISSRAPSAGLGHLSLLKGKDEYNKLKLLRQCESGNLTTRAY